MNQLSAYRSLETRFRRLAAIEGASSVLWWDQAAMMPAGGAEMRAEQLAELKLIRHELVTHPAVEELIGAPVYLDCWVKVLPRWRRNPAALAQFGFPEPDEPRRDTPYKEPA